MADQPLRLDGYIRVSKVGGRSGDSFISPDDQRERIASWARSRDVEIDEWHVDLDQTGGKLARPGLDKLMARIRSGQVGGVAVAYVDRLSRADVGDALRLVEEIHAAGGQFAALDLGIDPTTPFGEFGMTLLLALGRMQRRRISDGWDAATSKAVARGVHAHVPFGYRKSAGKGSPLEPDPVEAAVIPELFERRVRGESWAALGRWLDTQVPPRNSAQWTRRAVETIVRNPAYKGEARYGKHVNTGAHQALVGVDAWEAAQAVKGVRPSRGETALLSGLIRCAGCRHRLAPGVVGKPKAKIYRCRRVHATGTCTSTVYAHRSLIDEYVEREFLAHYGSLLARGFIANAGLEDARRQLADAEREVSLYRDNTKARELLERLGDGHFEAGLGSRVDAVLAARERLERTRQDATGFDIGPALAVWPDLSVGERREILAEGIDAVFLRRADVAGTRSMGDRVKIFWRGEAPHDLPGPGIRVQLRGVDW